jgi:hypothetical protein
MEFAGTAFAVYTIFDPEESEDLEPPEPPEPPEPTEPCDGECPQEHNPVTPKNSIDKGLFIMNSSKYTKFA